MSQEWSFGSCMKPETAGELERLCVARYGRERVRICVEVQPKAIRKTVDTEEDAQITIENLKKAEGK